jgi:hypothetical protein
MHGDTEVGRPRLSVNAQRALGFASIWPLVYVSCFVALLWRGADDVLGDRGMLALAVVHVATIIAALIAIGVDIALLVKMRELQGTRRVAWIVALVMFGIVSLPVFFVTYVRPLTRSGAQ